MISKKLFCEILEAIQLQILKDREFGSFFYTSSGANNTVISYNNIPIIKLCVKLLQEYFPKDENGFCEIEHYCFNLEFGKPTKEGNETETFEQLYKRLINNL